MKECRFFHLTAALALAAADNLGYIPPKPVIRTISKNNDK